MRDGYRPTQWGYAQPTASIPRPDSSISAPAGATTKPQESQAQATPPERTHPDTRETITQGQCQQCGYPGAGSTRQLVNGLCGCCQLRHATVVRTEFAAVCVQALTDAETTLRENRERFARREEPLTTLELEKHLEHERLYRRLTMDGGVRR